MPTWLRRMGSALLVLLLLAHAHSPTALSGYVGEDFATLVGLERVVPPGASTSFVDVVTGLFEVPGIEGHPLAAASLAVTNWLWSPASGTTVGVLLPRIENLVLLCLGAWAVGRLVRRLLRPWVGSDHGVAASRAASLLVLLHPAMVPAVASLGARGDLLALCLGAFGANLFLKSRQEHRVGLTVCSGLCTLAAGMSSGLALGLPVLLAAAELTSSRRYRPMPVRRRTALTTLVVFGACVSLAPAMYSALTGVGAGTALGLSGRDFGAAATIALVRFGSALLPVNQAAGGAEAFIVAGAVVLVALQPVPIAARSAPRLWGWFVSAGVLAVFLWELCSDSHLVRSADFTHAATLLPVGAVLGATLGVAATAVFGVRRVVLPIVVAAGWAFIGHQNAVAHAASAASLDRLRGDLLDARETWGFDARMLVIDPPRRVRGLDALAGALPWAVDPLFAGRPATVGDARADSVRALSRQAFTAFAREPEFEALRSEPLVVVVSAAALAGEVPLPGDVRREALLVPPPSPSTGMRSWFREGRAFRLDLEALSTGALVVRGAAEADIETEPLLAWRATEPLALDGRLAATWSSAQDAPEAVFDLSSSLPWLLGGRVEQMWSARGWSRIREARVLAALPEPPGASEPRVKADDWIFDGPEGTYSRPGDVWRVVLLDLSTLESAAFGAQPLSSERLEVPGIASRVAASLQHGGGPVAWALERLVDGRSIQRVQGRRIVERD